MLTKQTQLEPVGSSPAQWSKSPAGPLNSTASVGSISPATRSLACLGATLTIEGKITSEEDLQIDGKVQGPISLQGRRLTVVMHRRVEFRSHSWRSHRLRQGQW